MSDEAIRVHPAAAVFPMLSEDELSDLAADIKANGLLHPITLDRDGQIVDGRNRHAACLIADVDPDFEVLEYGVDPVVFILSQNVHRRHLTEGQRAIGVVRTQLYKLSISEMNRSAIAVENGVKRERITQALVIVEHAPELADEVMAKTKAFSLAYEDAKLLRDAKENREQTAARQRANLERVMTEDPDLHLIVSEGRLTLTEAIGVLDERVRRETERRERDSAMFARTTAYLHALLQADPSKIARDWLPSANGSAGITGCEQLWTRDGLRELAQWLVQAAAAWEDERKAGRMLLEGPKHPGGRPPENPGQNGQSFPPTLAELGVTYRQAKDWQIEAQIPDEVFRVHVEQAQSVRGMPAGACRTNVHSV